MERFVFLCQECGEYVVGSTPHSRCKWCGRVHELFGRKVIATSRPVHPLAHDSATLSPWMLPWERPTRPGVYEVKYAHGVFHMTWPGEWAGVVQSWRGSWQ